MVKNKKKMKKFERKAHDNTAHGKLAHGIIDANDLYYVIQLNN